MSSIVELYMWNRNPKQTAMLKILLTMMLAVVSVGCGDKTVQTVEPSPEKTPWLYPDKQIEMLSISDFKIKARAAINLGNMGAKAESAIPELEKLLEDENEKIQKIAQEAIDKIRADLDK